MSKFNEVKDLMREFEGSTLTEFAYECGNEKIAFSKNAKAAVGFSENAPAASVAVVEEVVAPVAVTVETPAPVAVEAEGTTVDSPIVGLVYVAPGPDQAPFVAVGDAVKKGQVLVIIEAMKVMNDIVADRDGVVTEILVDNQEVVEYGTPLVRIK
jgi:acetyl-CoA carboxylase biotin carboxyl carrier protein